MTLLKLLIAEYFDGIVWRMEIDSKCHILFAEIRNNEDRRVSFAAISLVTGKVYFKKYESDEAWLTGIETGHYGVMLLHFYQAASSPTHKGLAAIDAESGTMLWNNYNLAFDHLTINGPLFFDSRMQPPKFSIADIKTGVLQRGYQSVIDMDLDNHIQVPQQKTLPEHLPKLPVEPYSNNVHYLEYNNLIIVSLHALWMGQLRQYLFIAEGSELIFEDILNTNIQKLQPEAFVLYRNQLIYLKDRSEIKVLNL